MALLLLLQLVLLNHIHILGYAMPLVLCYLTMQFRRGSSRIAMLLWAFSMGLVYDVFSNSMGLGMATMTLMGMVQPVLLNLFTPRDSAEDMQPSIPTMGLSRYLTYALFTLLLQHIVFYLLDAFTLSNWLLTLTAIGIGTLLALVIVIFLQSVLSHNIHE